MDLHHGHEQHTTKDTPAINPCSIIHKARCYCHAAYVAQNGWLRAAHPVSNPSAKSLDFAGGQRHTQRTPRSFRIGWHAVVRKNDRASSMWKPHKMAQFHIVRMRFWRRVFSDAVWPWAAGSPRVSFVDHCAQIKLFTQTTRHQIFWRTHQNFDASSSNLTWHPMESVKKKRSSLFQVPHQNFDAASSENPHCSVWSVPAYLSLDGVNVSCSAGQRSSVHATFSSATRRPGRSRRGADARKLLQLLTKMTATTQLARVFVDVDAF